MAYIKDVQVGSDTYLIEPALYIAPSKNGAAYTATLTNFSLVTGATVQAKFAATNDANATLNVNSTGAKEIHYNGAKITASQFKVNHVYTLVYDGTQWQVVGDIDTNTTYSLRGLGGIGTISASGTAPLTLSGSKSGTTYTLTGSIADASASASGVVNTDAQTFSGVKTFDNGLHIYGTISTQGTGSVAGTMYPGGAYHSGHNSIILHGDTAGVSGIGFTSEKATKSGTTTNINSSSDRAFIQYHAYGVTPAAEGTAPTLATSGELGTLVIGVGNDANDTIRLQAPGTAGILHQIGATAYPIPHTTNTNGSVGGTTTPVYVEAGVIKAGTALGTASQKAESYFAKASHNHAASDINSGTFDVARIPNSVLKWQTTTTASTDLYDFGVYVNQNNAAGSSMNGGNYFNILNVPYRKASGNTKADWGWQLGNTTSNDSRLWYRTSGDNVWGDWQTIAHATQSTSDTGSSSQPVYMTKTGVITTITTVGAAYGGTGKTTLKDSANALINALDTGSSPLTANDYVITQYVGGGTTTTTYHRRPANQVVNGTLVKAALGTVGTTAKKFLKDTGAWVQVAFSDLSGTATNAQLANSKVTIAGNDVSLGGSLTAATLTSSLGLSNALHFIGITSTTLTDGSTTATLTAKSTNSLSKTTGFVDGDVVMDGDQLREYVWSGSAWRLLGITTSTAYKQPASTVTNTWIAQISQGTDGKITATTGSLNTSGTWSGNATTATTATNLSAKPSLTASGNNITVTAGGKTSDAFTVPYATKANQLASTQTVHHFWRGDNSWSNEYSGNLYQAQAYALGKSATPCYKVATFTQSISGKQINTLITFLVSSFYSPQAKGILEVSCRWEANADAPSWVYNRWLIADSRIDVNNFIATWVKDSANNVTLNLYCKVTGWADYNFVRMAEHNWGEPKTEWILNKVIGETGVAAIPSNETQIISVLDTIKNNTASATTATSAGKWTTARTLTIGNTGKSVDGSGNVSWSLAEIGAAPAVTGGYLPLSGGTLTGALNTTNNTWNKIGDDAQLGDINKAGHIGIQGINSNTGIFFTTYNQTNKLTGGAITWDGTKFSITSTTAVDASISGNAATATTATNLSAAPSITSGGTATVTLSANTAYTLTVGGKSVIFKTPADGNTDTKVTQAYSTGNTAYPILMTATAGNTSTASRGDTTTILNNNIYANPSAGIIYSSAHVTDALGKNNGWIAYPNGGTYSTSTSTITGALKITLPQVSKNTMMSFDVHIYTYEGTNATSTVYHISGYEYSANGWHNPVCRVYSEGTGNYTNLKVRFGADNEKAYITIGETNTAWSYPQVAISDILLGYSNHSYAVWGGTWNISFVTTLPSSTTGNRTDVNTQSINITGSAGSVAWTNVSDRPTNLNQFTNGPGYITGYTETDPTVPAWAKAASKPTYTYSEVGAAPSSTVSCTAANIESALGIDFIAHTGALNTNGWKTLGGRASGAKIAIAYNNNPASWNSATYSSSLVFGCSDTKGMIDISYNSPLVSIAGGNVNGSTDDAPKWYFKLSATSGQTYTFPSASKTLAASDGSNASGSWGISITGSAGSVAWANTGHPSTFPPESHTHGNLSNDGKISTAITIAANDYIIIGDNSDGGKIGKGPIFDASTETQCLTKKGTWKTFGTSNLTIGTTSSTAMAGNTVVTNVAISANTVANADYPIVFATSNTATTAAKNEGLQKSGTKFFANPSTGTLYSTKFCVDESVTLQYNTTDQSLDFIF